jgi:hypothetical protein
MLASAFDTDLIRHTWNLQRDYNWEIFLPDMGSLAGYQVAMYCQEVKFGDYVLDSDSMRYGAFQAKFPGTQGIEDVTFTFLKPVPDIVSSYFYYWKNLVVDGSGYYNVKSQYAKNLKVILYDTTGATSNTYTLVGVWPKSVPSYNISYKREGMVEVSITCSVDRVALGDYVPAQFQETIDQPIGRLEYQVSLGNSTQKDREATNATAFSYSTARYFSPAASRVSQGLAGIGVELGLNIASSILRPTPTYTPPYVPAPSPIPAPELRVEVPNSELGLISRYGGGGLNPYQFTTAGVMQHL